MADIVVNRPISTSDVEGFNAALALKLDAAIGFTALANNTTALTLASFAGKQVVTITYDDGLNKTITLDNDLKDGRLRFVRAYNSNATTIGLTLPAGIGDPSPAYLPQSRYIRISFVWDGTAWNRTYSGVWA